MGIRVTVHKIPMGDVEDPEIYAADPIIKFEKTEQGQWLHSHSTRQLEFIIRPNQETYGWMVIIFAWLEEQDLTYYRLKWGNQNEL
jgi:hypothetical protein